jgi:hypothetical protein
MTTQLTLRDESENPSGGGFMNRVEAPMKGA